MAMSIPSTMLKVLTPTAIRPTYAERSKTLMPISAGYSLIILFRPIPLSSICDLRIFQLSFGHPKIVL
jgi:hypothetical protein